MTDDRKNPNAKPPPGADQHEPFDDEFEPGYDDDFDADYDEAPFDDEDDWDESEDPDPDYGYDEQSPQRAEPQRRPSPPVPASPPSGPPPASPRARPPRKRTEIDPDLIASPPGPASAPAPAPAPSSPGSSSYRPAPAPPPPASASEPGGGQLHWQVDEPDDADDIGDERTLRKGDMILPPNYEIIRFIDAGGMGEVYEAKNVQTYERLAIKVILPEWARKDKVIQQFRDEARILVQLKDDALVPYVQFFYDPALELHGLMMGFVDGDNLADILDTLKPSPADLRTLLKRLASGLKVAHAAGAVHRDLSPDNVILRNRKIEEAVIIDFGIAKDIKGAEGQGDKGFSGKLDYASPEQLGMFGGVMDTPSDVYSLGLLMLAVARGEDMELGATRMDAVHRREDGIDTSAAPDDLRPVLDQMLVLDPAERLGTMDAVLAALAKLEAGSTTKPGGSGGWRGGGSGGGGRGPGGAGGALAGLSPVVAGGAAVGVLALLALGIWIMLPGSSSEEPDTQVAQGSGAGSETGDAPETMPEPVAMTDPVGEARRALGAAYPSIGCSWLDEVSIIGSQERIGVTLSGVAGEPAQVLSDVTRTLEGAGFSGPDVNLDGVERIGGNMCSVLDAFRQVRADGANRVRLPQKEFELTQIEGKGLASKFTFKLDDMESVPDFTLLSILPNDKLEQDVPDRAIMDRLVGRSVKKSGSGYEVAFYSIGEGWHGFALITGQGPFDPAIITPELGARDPQWAARFAQTARERGWQVEMDWYKLVDRQPD